MSKTVKLDAVKNFKKLFFGAWAFFVIKFRMLEK